VFSALRTLTSAIRKVHDFLTGVPPPAPLQGVAAANRHGLAAGYYRRIWRGVYSKRRDRLMGILTSAGFVCYKAARRVLHP